LFPARQSVGIIVQIWGMMEASIASSLQLNMRYPVSLYYVLLCLTVCCNPLIDLSWSIYLTVTVLWAENTFCVRLFDAHARESTNLLLLVCCGLAYMMRSDLIQPSLSRTNMVLSTLSIHLSFYLISIHLSIWLSIYRSIYWSIYLSIYLSINLI
jgi:hypothetical protein